MQSAATPTGPSQLMQLNRRYQKLLDDLTIYSRERWAFTGVLFFLYIIRAVTIEGWYVVTVHNFNIVRIRNLPIKCIFSIFNSKIRSSNGRRTKQRIRPRRITNLK
jgi:hypothetical protein